MPSEKSNDLPAGLRLAYELLTPKARRAIGNQPLPLVWHHLQERFLKAIEDHWEESKELLASYDLAKAFPDDLYAEHMDPGTNWDSEEVGERAALRLNALVRHNPDLDWQSVQKWHPLEAVRALLGVLKPEWHHYQVPEDEDDR